MTSSNLAPLIVPEAAAVNRSKIAGASRSSSSSSSGRWRWGGWLVRLHFGLRRWVKSRSENVRNMKVLPQKKRCRLLVESCPTGCTRQLGTPLPAQAVDDSLRKVRCTNLGIVGEGKVHLPN